MDAGSRWRVIVRKQQRLLILVGWLATHALEPSGSGARMSLSPNSSRTSFESSTLIHRSRHCLHATFSISQTTTADNQFLSGAIHPNHSSPILKS